MRFFVSDPRTRKKPGSHLALAIALATGTAMLSGVVAEPAQAQREKKDRKKKDEDRPQYSKEFVAAFAPLQEIVNAEGGDLAAATPQFPGLMALSQSPDEKLAAGGLVYNAGAKNGDRSLQLQGITLMLDSGKAAPEQLGRFNFIAYQLNNANGDYATSRGYLQKAIEHGFSTDNFGAREMRVAMAESFISENRFAEGLEYLARAIADTKAAGEQVDEGWYRRGLSVGYNNEVVPQVYTFASSWVGEYPSPANWRDAINIARNLNEFDGPETLDLLRLSRRVDALQEKHEYIDYIEAADARRLPREVKSVIEAAYANGRVSRDDIYVADSLRTADGRIASDQAELPSLERDARAADAGLRTVMAAGDTFLSYSQYGKAEEFYTKALSMPGADRATALTRLGIAQAEQGKFADAKATFAQVEGARKPIAMLWSAYADQKAAAAAPAAPAPAAPEAEVTETTT